MPNETTETGTIPFIVSTSLHKPDQDTRKFIRKHVMLGRNVGKGTGKHRNNNGNQRGHAPALIPLAIAPHPNGDTHAFTNTLPSDCPPSIPQRVGTDVSLIRLADAVEPSTLSLVLQFSAVAKQKLFPLEPCILFDKQEGRQWLELMTFDPVFLHTIVSTTLTYHDSLLGRQDYAPTNAQISLHFTKTLCLFRERLRVENDGAKYSDITIFIVLGLAICAYLTGERNAAEYHLAALRTIINIRGGLGVFWHTEKLLLELFRCDIGLSLSNGSTPFFFYDPLVEPFLPYPEEELLLGFLRSDTQGTKVTKVNNHKFLDEVDNDLAKAWSIMEQFSARINIADETKSKLPKELLLNTMASVMYRVMNMSYKYGSHDEGIRLGLLAYSSSIFLQWSNTRMSYHYFSTIYRDFFTTSYSSDLFRIHFRLWFLMTGAVSIFKEHDDQWLKSELLFIIDLCRLERWDQVRDILRSIMWVDLLHDHLGKKFFDYIVN